MTNPTNPRLDGLAERLQRVLASEAARTDEVAPVRRRSMFAAPSHGAGTVLTAPVASQPITADPVSSQPVSSQPVVERPVTSNPIALTTTQVSSIPAPVVLAEVPGAFLPFDSEQANVTLHGQIDRVYRLCYRMAYRLLGRRNLAEAVAADAVRSVVGQPMTTHTRLALGFVLETILGQFGELRLSRNGDHAVVHADHRDRLARELRRNSPADRMILAVRHLGGLGVEDTALIVGKPIAAVRLVTSRWTPEDDLDPSGELITNLDAWTPPENPEEAAGATLAHLDDPLEGAQPAIHSVTDLPSLTLAHTLAATG